MRWVDRQDEAERADQPNELNRVLSRLVAAVWLAMLGYVMALVWLP